MTTPARTFFIIKICASVAALGLMLFYDSIPKRTLQLYPQPNLYINDFVDSAENGLSKLTWINTDKLHWVCELKQGAAYRFCGVSISWSAPPYQAIDLSQYDGLLLNLEYKGESEYIRVFIQSTHPQISARDNLKLAKFNSITTLAPYPEEVLKVQFSDLRVADWWIDNLKIKPENTYPDVSQSFAIGVDLPYLAPLGLHEFRLKNLIAEGSYLEKEPMYLGIILFWLALVSLEVISKNFHLNKRLKIDTQKFIEMQEKTALYKEKAETDNLTGIYNRDGLNQMVENFKSIKLLHHYALIVLDLDHFKNINDQFGHNDGDLVLKECAQLLKNHMRSYDVLARWGGEEFVILLYSQDKNDIASFVEKTRQDIENAHFLEGKCASTTISIGVTQITKSDLFENAFLRADKALYQAKEEGRNRFILI